MDCHKRLASRLYGLSSACGVDGYVARFAQRKGSARARGERPIAPIENSLETPCWAFGVVFRYNFYHACNHILPLVPARKIPLPTGVLERSDITLFPCDYGPRICAERHYSQGAFDDYLRIVALCRCGVVVGRHSTRYSADDPRSNSNRCGIWCFATYNI